MFFRAFFTLNTCSPFGEFNDYTITFQTVRILDIIFNYVTITNTGSQIFCKLSSATGFDEGIPTTLAHSLRAYRALAEHCLSIWTSLPYKTEVHSFLYKNQ